MKRGRIEITKSWLNDKNWPLIRIELSNVMLFEKFESKPFGVTEIHGTSPLFDESKEGESPRYLPIFSTVNDKPVFKKFVKATT